MFKALILSTLAALAGTGLLADEAKSFNLGGDRYSAGRSVVVSDPVAGDVFAAGEKLQLSADIGGAAHLAGRVISVSGELGGALYAAGYRVDLSGDVGGGASLVGAELAIPGHVAGNLRASGSDLSLTGSVGGAALLSGAELALEGTIGGDAVVTADKLTFGPDAKVAGRLTVYAEDPEKVTVPDHVAPADRVTVKKRDEMKAAAHKLPDTAGEMAERGFGTALRGFLLGVLVVAVAAAGAVALAPEKVAAMRTRALAQPGRSVLAGFLAMSALFGAVLVLAMTVAGLLLVPVAMALAGLMVFAGYVAGSYVLGVALWQAAGRPLPTDVPHKAGLAALGALVAGVIALVPLLGWLAWLGLVFLGLGALSAPVFSRVGALGHTG